MSARTPLFTELSRIATGVLLVSSLVSGLALADAGGQAPAPQQPANSAERPREGGRQWWSDPDVKRELKLSDEKARVIEGIFQKRQVEAKAWWDQLQREQDRLTRMTRERLADEATYALQVSKVEAIAARLREGRTVMLYRMYLELQPEQFKKLQDLMDRWRNSGRGRGPDPGR